MRRVRLFVAASSSGQRGALHKMMRDIEAREDSVRTDEDGADAAKAARDKRLCGRRGGGGRRLEVLLLGRRVSGALPAG